MKTLVYFFALLISVSSFAQTKRFIDRYSKETGLFKSLTIPMGFDSDSIQRAGVSRITGQVLRIDYVASSFSERVDSYQKSLDKKRWEKLIAFTGIDPTAPFEYNIYYQTSAQTEDEAKKLFHGFVVYYDKPQSAWLEPSQNGLSDMINSITETTVNDQTKTAIVTRPKFIDSINTGNLNQDKMDRINTLNMKENVIVEWGFDSISRDKVYHNAWYKLKKVTAGIFAAYTALKDKSVLQMFNRIRFNKNTLIVTDLTCSMYPYFSQIVMWHTLRLNNQNNEHYVFFNDGDGKPNSEKEIGSTGGLYPVKTNNLLQVFRTMEDCMSKGCSGDTPENNFEAVLHGIEKYDSIQKVVLICDNWAIPRDTSLLNNISVPIDFVMCGTTLGINPVYLNLARKNKGTIHTVEKSLTALDMKKEGELFTIGNRIYTIKKGQVVEKI